TKWPATRSLRCSKPRLQQQRIGRPSPRRPNDVDWRRFELASSVNTTRPEFFHEFLEFRPGAYEIKRLIRFHLADFLVAAFRRFPQSGQRATDAFPLNGGVSHI